jgi:hypothetical protein
MLVKIKILSLQIHSLPCEIWVSHGSEYDNVVLLKQFLQNVGYLPTSLYSITTQNVVIHCLLFYSEK